jgi:hypothetical protein
MVTDILVALQSSCAMVFGGYRLYTNIEHQAWSLVRQSLNSGFFYPFASANDGNIFQILHFVLLVRTFIHLNTFWHCLSSSFDSREASYIFSRFVHLALSFSRKPISCTFPSLDNPLPQVDLQFSNLEFSLR